MPSLQWLADTHPELILLVWDLSSAARNQQIGELGRALHVRLLLTSPGVVHECQPLDRRIFGSLKQRAGRCHTNKMLQGALDKLASGGLGGSFAFRIDESTL
jgi:hypothetical protein